MQRWRHDSTCQERVEAGPYIRPRPQTPLRSAPVRVGRQEEPGSVTVDDPVLVFEVTKRGESSVSTIADLKRGRKKEKKEFV